MWNWVKFSLGQECLPVDVQGKKVAVRAFCNITFKLAFGVINGWLFIYCILYTDDWSSTVCHLTLLTIPCLLLTKLPILFAYRTQGWPPFAYCGRVRKSWKKMYSNHAYSTPFSVKDILSWTEQQQVAAGCGIEYPSQIAFSMGSGNYPSNDLSPRSCDQLTMLSSASPSTNNNLVSISNSSHVNPACLYGTSSPPNFLQSSYSQSLSYNMGAALNALHTTTLKDYDGGLMADQTAITSPCLEEDTLDKSK